MLTTAEPVEMNQGEILRFEPGKVYLLRYLVSAGYEPSFWESVIKYKLRRDIERHGLIVVDDVMIETADGREWSARIKVNELQVQQAGFTGVVVVGSMILVGLLVVFGISAEFRGCFESGATTIEAAGPVMRAGGGLLLAGVGIALLLWAWSRFSK